MSDACALWCIAVLIVATLSVSIVCLYWDDCQTKLVTVERMNKALRNLTKRQRLQIKNYRNDNLILLKQNERIGAELNKLEYLASIRKEQARRAALIGAEKRRKAKEQTK